MPKTAITILAFISNPTTKKDDIAALCEQIHVVYDGNRKVSTIVADAVIAIYEACAKEDMAVEIYNKVEAIAAMHHIPLEEPLFVDMLACQKDPVAAQKTRDNYRQHLIESTAS